MDGASRSEADLVVLHALRCCGAASVERLAATVAPVLSVDVEDVLLDLAAQGLVTRSRGPFGSWQVTDRGRDVDAERIAGELDGADARPEVQAAYDAFLPLNQRTLDLCTEWQVRSWEPMVLNDHADSAYDRRVLARLAALDLEAQAVCARLAARLHRFSGYGPRLASALDGARGGRTDLVTDSLDSYHTTWFQLHEDLLVTLGLRREAPPS